MSEVQASDPAVIESTLLWTPRAKQRPRTAFKQGRYRTYTPAGTAEAELSLARQWARPPVDGPIAVGLILTDSYVKVTLEQSAEPVSTRLRRGDIDNYAKLIIDALNGVAWVDDRQICQLTVVKV